MLPLEALTEQIIGIAMKIHRKLGCGYLESVYQACMEIELTKAGIPFESRKKLDVWYEGQRVGTFEADIVVLSDPLLILELKAAEVIAKAHEAQLVNYLTNTNIEDGIIINFGATSLQTRRKFRTYRPSNINRVTNHPV